MTKNKIFLGGTTDSNWREWLIPRLNIEYFNPILENWTSECQKEEILQKEECNIHLYVITPKINGVYSIAEAVESAMCKDKICIFCILPEDDGKLFSDEMAYSLLAVRNLILKHGGKTCTTLLEVLEELSKIKL